MNSMKLHFSESGIDADVFLEELADADDTVDLSEPPPLTPPPPTPSLGKIMDEPECWNDALACTQLGQHGVKDMGRTWKIFFDMGRAWETLWAILLFTGRTWATLWRSLVRHGVKDLGNTVGKKLLCMGRTWETLWRSHFAGSDDVEGTMKPTLFWSSTSRNANKKSDMSWETFSSTC